MGDAFSHKNKILNELHADWPEWTPAPRLAQISLQYSARIFSLRHDDGWEISNKIEIVDGVKHGFFRLGAHSVPSNRELRAQRRATAEEMPKPQPAETLFDFGPLPD
jgi:hypothetical protein